ncbi:hypothetical protein ACTJIJ_22910 [Niabella sp. 22666]|uniref:hypothetical protein n=1 Tax=Niabella sp. 22666 TaxID=3453954 RepID=UPI003F85139F
MRAEIYVKYKTTERNPYVAIVAMNAEPNNGAWNRVLKHIGCNADPVAVRPMVQDEIDNVMNSWRMRYLKYSSLVELVADEIRVTQDHKFIQRLISRLNDPAIMRDQFISDFINSRPIQQVTITEGKQLNIFSL